MLCKAECLELPILPSVTGIVPEAVPMFGEKLPLRSLIDDE